MQIYLWDVFCVTGDGSTANTRAVHVSQLSAHYSYLLISVGSQQDVFHITMPPLPYCLSINFNLQSCS
jgi:hypothetical protein